MGARSLGQSEAQELFLPDDERTELGAVGGEAKLDGALAVERVIDVQADELSARRIESMRSRLSICQENRIPREGELSYGRGCRQRVDGPGLAVRAEDRYGIRGRTWEIPGSRRGDRRLLEHGKRAIGGDCNVDDVLEPVAVGSLVQL